MRISVPSDGSVGGTPTPRKERVASVMMATAMLMVAMTSTGPKTFGSTWKTRMARGRRPMTRGACAYSFFLSFLADVQLSFPAILIALLIDGVARVALPSDRHDAIAIPVLIVSIGLSLWVGYARTVRGSTMVEREKEYVQ